MKHDKYSLKTDANQAKIVEALRKKGYSVTCTHMVGGGFPDITVGANHKNILIEIKQLGKTLNEQERKWHVEWQGQVAIAYTPDEAIQIVEALTK